MTSGTIEQDADRTLPGKYLTILLGGERYGLEMLRVREVIRPDNITPMPQMPEYIRGVVNLGGKIVPVVDLGVKFGLGKREITPRTCVVVLHVSGTGNDLLRMGLIADAVDEVVTLSVDDIARLPDAGLQSAGRGYLAGSAKINNQTQGLLDINRLLGLDQLAGQDDPAT